MMKENVDIVIISNAKTKELIETTENTLKTLYSSENDINFITYVIESCDVSYNNINENIKTINTKEVFGYNKYLNMGIKLGGSDYICLCNNDLIFKNNWASTIIKEMELDNLLLSASPYSDNPHKIIFDLKKNSGNYYGYQVPLNVCGWAIFQKRKIYEIIGDLDENFIFWYSDNDYAKTLESKKIKHALITNSEVNHLSSSTLKTCNKVQFNQLTKEQHSVFIKKWGRG